MWRRFGMGQQQPLIGNPSLIDTSVDASYLETIHEVESIISRQSSVRHPSVLPELPFRAVPPMNQQGRHERASSVYSQPSPTMPDERATNMNDKDDRLSGSDAESSEVSSLTIRSSLDNDSRNSPLVSPISAHFPETDAPPSQDHPFRSQLPRPVLFETQAARAAASYRKPAPEVTTEKRQETRWDDFSGEPTDSDSGKPASARLCVAPVEVQYPQMKERTKQILAELRERDAAKKPVWGKAPPPVDDLDHPVYREPWKGASGRAALVEPVKNNPAARLEPLHIPQRNISRTHAISNEAARSYNSQSQAPQASGPEQRMPTIRAVASQDSIKPVVPLKLGSNNGSRVVSPTTPMTAMAEQSNNLQSPFKSPHHNFPHAVTESITKPAEQDRDESPTDNEPVTPTTPTQTNISTQQTRADSLLPPEPEEADVSRFSWTTYTATEPGSPMHSIYHSSPIPPLPSMPLLLRKRPVPPHGEATSYINPNAAVSSTSVVSRKPVPSADRNRSASMSTIPLTGKSLPQCPPELEASDKITTLQARLDDLGRRKRNKRKIKAALTEELRRNAVAYVASKRKDVESKLKNLDGEMDEITQEEHEVGLQLHRAQKKKDREENNLEPTSLWIKRVTS